MSKPIGVDIFLNVKFPTEVENIIWDAVEKAIDAKVTPERFRKEIIQAWDQISYEKYKETVKSVHSTFK